MLYKFKRKIAKTIYQEQFCKNCEMSKGFAGPGVIVETALGPGDERQGDKHKNNCRPEWNLVPKQQPAQGYGHCKCGPSAHGGERNAALLRAVIPYDKAAYIEDAYEAGKEERKRSHESSRKRRCLGSGCDLERAEHRAHGIVYKHRLGDINTSQATNLEHYGKQRRASDRYQEINHLFFQFGVWQH